MSSTDNLTYDVFINDPLPQDGFLPNGEPKRFSLQASTLIYGSEDAVLTDPAMTTDQARALGDWVAAKGRNLTDIFVTHGYGDHWFAAGLLAERFGARVVASAGMIAQMHANVAQRPVLWDRVYSGIPETPVTAVTVPGNRFTLEGHDLVIVEVGHTDSDDTSVLHIPISGWSSPAMRSTTALTCTSSRVMAPLPAAPPDVDRRWVLRVPPDPQLRFDTCDLWRSACQVRSTECRMPALSPRHAQPRHRGVEREVTR